MRDAIGNRLTKGNVVLWKSKDLMMQVVDVIEPKVEVIGQPKQPPALVLQILIPVNVEPGRRSQMDDVMLGDFLRVVDPQAEAALESVIAAGKMQ